MLILLKMEDVYNYQRQKLKNSKINKKLKTLCNKTCKAPWIAEIVANKRIFVRGRWDYENINYHGTRNVMVSFFLNDDKLYEIFDPKNNERYFCKTEKGKIIKQ